MRRVAWSAVEATEAIQKRTALRPAVALILGTGLGDLAAELEHAVASSPNYADAVLLLAELNIRAGKAQTAVDPLTSLVQKRPDLVRAQILLADALQAVGRPDDAAAVIREQIKAAPQNLQPYLLLGLMLLKQKKTGEARQAFEKVIELDKKNVQAIDELVSLDITGKDFASARRRIADLLQQSPPSAVAYYLQKNATVHPCDDVLFHYWAQKAEYQRAIETRLAAWQEKPLESALEELRRNPIVLPPYVPRHGWVRRLSDRIFGSDEAPVAG